MFRSSTRRPLLLGGLAVAALSFTACGSGDENAGLDEFCNKFEAFDSADALDDTPEKLLSDFRDLADAAPDGIRSEMQEALAATEVLTDAAAKFEGGEEIDIESPELLQAGDDLDRLGPEVEEFVESNCREILGS